METLISLFISFLKIGCFSIGGGYATIPLIQEQVVTLHQWMSMQEFKDIITISQMTPGPLAINTSTFVGLRIAGIPGSILATVGCILCGALISIFLYRFFMKHKDSNTIFQILSGLKSASIGFIGAASMTIVAMSFQQYPILENSIYLIIMLICFLLVRKYKLHPMMVMVIAGCLGLLVY